MEKNQCFLFQKYFLFLKIGQKKCPKMRNLEILLKKPWICCIFLN